MIRIGETHVVSVMRPDHDDPYINVDEAAMYREEARATEAVKRLVEAVKEWRDTDHTDYEGCVRVNSKMLTALAPFTESDVALVDSGLRSCATPENDGSTPPKGADQ